MFEYEFNTYEVVTSGVSSLLGLQYLQCCWKLYYTLIDDLSVGGR